MNKPLGLLTTARDDRGRKTVCDLVQNAHKDNLVPVGRLDQASTGLLLLTNETNWIHKLLHPKYVFANLVVLVRFYLVGLATPRNISFV